MTTPTHGAGVIDEDDLPDEMTWRSVDDAVDCPQQHGEPLIVERDDDGGAGQVLRVRLARAPAKHRGMCVQLREIMFK